MPFLKADTAQLTYNHILCFINVFLKKKNLIGGIIVVFLSLSRQMPPKKLAPYSDLHTSPNKLRILTNCSLASRHITASTSGLPRSICLEEGTVQNGKAIAVTGRGGP
jgi:hypothetical protein